ncbi:hypothetical protein DXG03_006116 [Asterophora parasitica]|uniref:Uncharacterized protein n=1 Tax=Asterophora parasitica TaxID=117018 RepID=A0A9P7GJJ6_9AGAR|nr:hypothetical protein DXG03_006116 [Asterophora parasitica]
MLKRQRQSSPPPSIPLIEDPFPFQDITEARRNSKRRRVLPPSLDGNSRGWGVFAPPSQDNDEDEEYVSEEDEGTEDNGDRSRWAPYLSEYKDANNVLNELHTLQQHRLLFSSGHASSQVNDSSVAILSSPGSHHENTYLLSKIHPTHRPLAEIKDPAFDTAHSAGPRHPKDEVIRVTERYGDSNRSRRLQRFINSLSDLFSTYKGFWDRCSCHADARSAP